MAQAANQHTRIHDLDDALHYLTVELGYRKGVAVFMMNERYLVGDLRLEKQDIIGDDEPYGGWIAIDAKFGHLELDRHGRMQVVPRIKLWRKPRYRIAEGCDVRAIWSPASQPAPEQQPKDKAGLDPVDADADGGLSAGQAPQESKADGWQAGALRRRSREVRRGDVRLELT